MLILIDNYDSFTYNIYQYLSRLGCKVRIFRNDKVTVRELEKKENSITGFIISPGPGRPEDAGVCLELISHFYRKIPILGVCLGHQAIAQSLGGKVVRAPKLMHGKLDLVHHNSRGVYTSLSNPLTVTRYHSLMVEEESLPNCFLVNARSKDGVVMGIKHRRYPLVGVQFHPESYMTQMGIRIFENFLKVSLRRKKS